VCLSCDMNICPTEIRSKPLAKEEVAVSSSVKEARLKSVV